MKMRSNNSSWFSEKHIEAPKPSLNSTKFTNILGAVFLLFFFSIGAEASWLSKATGIDINFGKGTIKLEKPNPGGVLTDIKKDFDPLMKAYIKAVRDAEREFNSAKGNIDKELERAWRNLVTEWNYFFATVCGEHPKYKKLTRDYNQGKISRTEYIKEVEKLIKEIGPNKGC